MKRRENARQKELLPCLALPCLALPCLALPCLALPCLALQEAFHFSWKR
ncbi:hypothetical protein H2549_005008 [Salmonella enterica subsp. enterica serovar Stanley]|nr:hypothetical protein [Salmonella enterica subsp. enterica serovar Stanley]